MARKKDKQAQKDKKAQKDKNAKSAQRTPAAAVKAVTPSASPRSKDS